MYVSMWSVLVCNGGQQLVVGGAPGLGLVAVRADVQGGAHRLEQLPPLVPQVSLRPQHGHDGRVRLQLCEPQTRHVIQVVWKSADPPARSSRALY